MLEPSEIVPISDLKDTFLECPVCVEHFNQTDRRPRLLHSCLHAFCTQCLQQLLEKEGKGQITCPLCRQVQKVTGKVESLPKDPVRDQLVEYLQITHKQNILCKDCPDEHSAQSRCMECGENLCQECENAHKRNRSTRSHRIVSFEELGTESCGPMKIRHFCPSHSDRLIECFCSKCETLSCLLCAVIDHKGHDFKKLDDAANIKIKELEKMLTNVDKVSSKLTTAKSDCEAYIDSIHEDKERAVSEINKSYEALADLLRKRQFFLLREVEERSQKLVAIAKKSVSQYDDALTEIESTQTYFSNAKSTDEVSLLQTYPSLKKTLSQITRNHSDDMKKFTQKFAFEAVEEENLCEQISGYGAVKDFKREGHRYYTKSKEEKKKYDHDFLLSLRHSRLSTKTPQSLPNISEIIPDIIDELNHVEKSFDVAISVNKSTGYITLYGLVQNVAEACGSIHETIRKIDRETAENEYAEDVTTLVQWFFVEVTEEGDDNMVAYEKEVNVKLERAYSKEKRKELMYEGYVFDFENWVEYPVTDKTDQVKMIRKDKVKAAAFNMPDTWDDMPADIDVLLKPVNNGSSEFDRVQKKFRASLGQVPGQIVRLDRIQSKILYQQYQAKKQQMEKQNPGVPVEMSLWHGTQTSATMSISTYGFNRSYCNKEQNALGEGAYFTTNAGYAARDRYAPADPQNKRYMFMCKVLTGTYTQGQPQIRVPPPKDPNNKQIMYDSVVDDPTNPQTFVIFSDTQAYPEYLISFQ